MRKFIVYLLVITFVFAPLALVFASFQSAPNLPQSAALSPAQAAKSKAVLGRVRQAARTSDGPRAFTATQQDLDAIIASVGRIAQPLRGETRIDDTGVYIALAAKVPNFPQFGWANFSLQIAPSDKGLEFKKFRLGRISFPPELTVKTIVFALDTMSSDNVGSSLLGLVGSVSTVPGQVEVTFREGGAGGGDFVERVMSGVRKTLGVSDPARVRSHYNAFSAAVQAGDLPKSGSVAPWISFALERGQAAREDTAEERQAEWYAALLALAAHCGDAKAINTIAGNVTGNQRGRLCDGLRLSGRADLRKHFILSAAMQVAGGSTASFGVGEVKELIDAGAEGGSGFSFDDIAADRAGIRFAETAAAAGDEDLQGLIELASREENFMPSIEGLDSLMSQAEFLSRFGGVDSPAYVEKLDEIDARIDALAIFANG